MWPGQENTGLDHFYTNKPQKLSEIQVQHQSSSDHKLIFGVRYAKNITRNVRYVKKRSYKTFDSSKFINKCRKQIITKFCNRDSSVFFAATCWWSPWIFFGHCKDREAQQTWKTHNRLSSLVGSQFSEINLEIKQRKYILFYKFCEAHVVKQQKSTDNFGQQSDAIKMKKKPSPSPLVWEFPPVIFFQSLFWQKLPCFLEDDLVLRENRPTESCSNDISRF